MPSELTALVAELRGETPPAVPFNPARARREEQR